MKTHKIAVIAGDGIGKEVMPEGLRALEATAARFRHRARIHHLRMGRLRLLRKHGKMMPDDWKAQLDGFEAIYFGAVGWPDIVPDHISLWGSLLKFRREFDQYVNLRPVRLMPGVPCPLANKKPGDIDFYVVRENTEGEYSSVGGRMFEGTDRELVLQEAVFTRNGTDRILKYAFELAQRRPKKHLTAATKSNGIAISMPYWDERVAAMGEQYRTSSGTSTTSTSWRALRAVAGALRRGGGVEPVRRHPVRPGSGLHRHDRHRAFGQPEPGAQLPVAVRAGARLRARHLRQEHRQPDRDDLVRRDDAGLPRQWRRQLHAAHDAIVRAIETCWCRARRTPDLGGSGEYDRSRQGDRRQTACLPWPSGPSYRRSRPGLPRCGRQARLPSAMSFRTSPRPAPRPARRPRPP
jgi:hypothetical protein